MRVLFQARPDLFTNPGGDTIQIQKTKDALELRGIEIDLSLDLSPNLAVYDLVHLFNITRVHETYLQALNANQQRKPIVLSTIYWNMDEYKRFARNFNPIKRTLGNLADYEPLRRRLLTFRDFLLRESANEALKLQRAMGFRNQQIAVLHMADILLPNSLVEYKLIQRDFSIDKPFMVVPNAADCDFAYSDKKAFVSEFGLEDFILAVGNIAIRKNYLALIRALKDTDLRIVIAGRTYDAEKRYAKLCRKEAGKHVLFIDGLERDMLASAYAAAKVHVLPSWYETPGLASLEAGLAGCNVVSTDRGSAKEYFGDLVWYCDPADLNSIRKAVLGAYAAPKTESLKKLIAEKYTWDKAADITLNAYLA